MYEIDIHFLSLDQKVSYLLVQVLLVLYYFILIGSYSMYVVGLYILNDSIIDAFRYRVCHLFGIFLFANIMCLHIGIMVIALQKFAILNGITSTLNQISQTTLICNHLKVIGNIHRELCHLLRECTSFCSVPLTFLILRVYLVSLGSLLSFSGMVPWLRSEIAYWVVLYWSLYLVNASLCEALYIIVSLHVVVLLFGQKVHQICCFK